MGHKGTFDLPLHAHNSTRGARRVYRNIWERDWPHDDDYLRLLAREVDLKHDDGSSKCEGLLWAMRECHEFETA